MRLIVFSCTIFLISNNDILWAITIVLHVVLPVLPSLHWSHSDVDHGISIGVMNSLSSVGVGGGSG
jgi:hypothetical protein